MKESIQSAIYSKGATQHIPHMDTQIPTLGVPRHSIENCQSVAMPFVIVGIVVVVVDDDVVVVVVVVVDDVTPTRDRYYSYYQCYK
jgi:hypothetical protein